MTTKTLENLVVSKDNLLQGLNKARCNYDIAALTKKGERWLYDYVKDSGEICLNYKPTVLSPKKFFFPQDEAILSYTNDGKVNAKIEAKPLVLFGIRPCDLNGIKILTEAFADDHGDPNYLAKREKAVLIGIDCHCFCGDKHAFCYKVKGQNVDSGYDVMLYASGKGYAIEAITEKGRDFVVKYFQTEAGSGKEVTEFNKQKEANFAKYKPFPGLDKFPQTFKANSNHPIWEKEGSRCLSCGSCIMVCPTCYCFDVKDEWNLNLKGGERVRCWDACMLDCFATVSGGENFRKHATERLHHRINRKFEYLMEKHKQAVCVGCGRCVRACLAEISPKTIAAAISGDNDKE
jgi:sulfhydrogenase subunit beta (sulfur reductase)